MNSEWILNGFWMSSGGIQNELWMNYAWALHELGMNSEWVLNGFWMSSAWFLIEFCMNSEGVLDGCWMSSIWILNEFWISYTWVLNEFHMRLRVLNEFWMISEWVLHESCISLEHILNVSWMSSEWILNGFWMDSEWILSKEVLAYRELVACKHEFPRLPNLAARVLCWDNFKYAFNILVVSDGMYSVNLGGLQADLKGGSGGAVAPPGKKYPSKAP